MNSERWAQTGRILLLVSIGIGLQGRPALSQSTGSEVYPPRQPNQTPWVLPSPDIPAPTTEDEPYQKALADFRAGKLRQAARELQLLHSAAARNALGVVLEAMGDHNGALSAFQDALRLQPDFPGAAYNTAKLLMQQGRSSAAISQLESALKKHRDGDDTTYSMQMLLAEAYAADGQDKQAAKTLEGLVAERPDLAQAHFYLAMTYASSDSPELDRAVEQYREGLRLKPKDCAGLMGLAKALMELRKGSEAVPYLQEYVRLRPNDGEGYYFLSRALRAKGRLNEAAETLAKAARLSPDDYKIRYQAGMALWRIGNLEAALAQFEAAKRLKPDDVEAHSALARLLRAMGKEEEARKEIELTEQLGARKARRDQASFHVSKGNLLLEKGDLKGAEEMYRKALELDPEDARARSNLGLVLARLNDPQGARAELKRAIALDPNVPEAYNALGICYSDEGQLSEAKTAFQQAIRVDPQYAEAKNNLASLYAKLGKNDEALALFKEAVEDSPQYPQPYLNWGLVLASEGNLSQAKEMIEKALQLSPNLTGAHQALQMVEASLRGKN